MNTSSSSSSSSSTSTTSREEGKILLVTDEQQQQMNDLEMLSSANNNNEENSVNANDDFTKDGSDRSFVDKNNKGSSSSLAIASTMERNKPVEPIHLSIQDVTYAPISQTVSSKKKKKKNKMMEETSSSSFINNNNNKSTVEYGNNDDNNVNNNSDIGPSSSKQVEIGNDRSIVLDNVSADIEPYKLTAWMGPSGSGKSSLIKVAAGLVQNKKQDLIYGRHGRITVNGTKGDIPKHMVSVVWQDDLLLSNLSVKETVWFAARLKTSKDISNDEVSILVDQVIDELGLTHVKDSLIGGAKHSKASISGGERKRVAVAVEMVGRPSVLLLDEPTSGLDATSALHLMETLKSLTKLGHSVVTVVHQPRTKIYDLIDDLLLLSKGRVVYKGRASKACHYLEQIPTVGQLPPQTGIADWIMDTIDADQKLGPTKSILANHWTNLDRATKESLQQQEDDNNNNDTTTKHSSSVPRRLSSLTELKQNVQKYQVGFLTQFKLLVHRSMKQRRGEKLTSAALLVSLAYTFFTSMFWWQLPDTTDRIFERTSLMFFIIVAQSNRIVTEGVTVFQQERMLIQRERAKKLYETLPYFIANSIADATSSILLPCLYGGIIYWTAGLRPTAPAFLSFMLILYLTVSAAQSMGLFLSILIPNLQISLMLAPLLTLLLIILGGFYIPFENMNPAISWASWISMARYGFSGFIIVEFQNRYIECNFDSGVGLNFAKDDGDGGTSSSSSSTNATSLCPVSGNSVIESYGIEGIMSNVWINVMFLIILQVVLRAGAFILLKRTL